MGIFGDWAQKYHDLDINVLPIAEDKKPPKGFTFKKWLTEKQTQTDIDILIQGYGHQPGIAVICGPVSGICGFDLDYKWDEKKITTTKQKWKIDYDKIEQEIIRKLPEPVLSKQALTGWTSFFKNNGWFHTLTADRNGVRLFDFKATGYIVIPPSYHSISKGVPVTYKWLTGEPLNDFKNLPEIDFQLIKELAILYGDKSNKIENLMNNRHGRIFIFGASLSKIEQDTDKIANELIKYDKKVHKKDLKGLYFKDVNHVGRNPEQYAKDWAKRIASNTRYSKIKFNEAKTDSNIYDYFFENKVPYGEIKKDVLTKEIFYRHPSENRWASGIELIPSLKSYGRTSGLNKDDIQNEFLRFQAEYKKLSFLTELPEHDGRDYLRDYTDCLVAKEFDSEELYDIFYQWFYNMFSKIYNSETQNRCIILKGKQGLGKDVWVRSIVKDFKPYYQSIDISTNKDEIVSAVQRIFISHLEEFDQTKKLDAAFIKALITRPTSFFRQKYGVTALERMMKASWISTVNDVDSILRDESGNRRFIVLDLENIDWSYDKKVGLKILSQMHHAYLNKKLTKPDQSTEKKIKTILDRYTPDNLDILIDEMLKQELHGVGEKIHTDRGYVILCSKAQHTIKGIANDCSVSSKRVQSVAKRYQIFHRKKRCYALYMLKDEN